MKRLTYLLIFVASLGYSQSNLVFNQALLLTLSSSTTYTVPLGKVWKIEAPSLRGTNTSTWLILDGAPFNFAASNVGTITPIWLPEGTEVSYGIGSGSFENQPTNIVSILEFDVVPVSTTSTGSGGLSSEGLQFSRVINYSDDHRFLTPNLYWHDYEPIEIPEGKVWKITSINVSSMIISSNPDLSPYMYRPQNQTFVTIGDIISVFVDGTNGGAAYPYNNRSEEIWLNEGLKTIKVTNGNNEKIRLTFTAIEYNIPQ